MSEANKDVHRASDESLIKLCHYRIEGRAAGNIDHAFAKENIAPEDRIPPTGRATW